MLNFLDIMLCLHGFIERLTLPRIYGCWVDTGKGKLRIRKVVGNIVSTLHIQVVLRAFRECSDITSNGMAFL